MTTDSEQNHPRSKLLAAAGYGYLVLFVLLILSKSLLTQSAGGWSDPPIYYHILLFGLGVCTALIGGIYSYIAWARNAQEYVAWFARQSLNRNNWQIKLMIGQPGYSLWTARLIAPLVTLSGMVFIVFTVIQIAAVMAGGI